ncbi:MAG: TRAP transporter small permease [Myxococcales bacterium]|nr:TRAP transporter small permease [Myxococcales bacterium]
MRKLRELEDVLIRVESALAVVLVLTMLLLAGYNVVYRNVLVPLQQHWAHSGPPVPREEATPEAPAEAAPTTPAEPRDDARPEPAGEGRGDDFSGFGGGFGEGGDAKPEPAGEGGGDDFGGFGGGFGEDEPAPDESAKPAPEPEVPAPEKAGGDDFGGFGGGFGEDEPAKAEPEKAEPEKAEPEKAAPETAGGDDFGGFGGGFGGDEPAKAEPAKAEGGDFGGFGGGFDEGTPAEAPAAEDEGEDDDGLGDDDFGDPEDQFANLPSIDAVAEVSTDEGPLGGPPPPGSFAAWAVDFVDAIKLDWIDVFLRQLVIIVAFLGAMMATRRGKHINIDALSKVLPESARRVVPIVLNLASLGVCLMLASAGWDLVRIGQEYPKDLVPWAEEWKFQLMFPVGFGLMAVHFAMRLLESIVEGPPAETLRASEGPPLPPAEPRPDDEPEDGAGASADEDDEPADASDDEPADASDDEEEAR